MAPPKSLDAIPKKNQEKKLLVLDLDETLVHSRHTTFGEEADFSFTLIEQGCIYYVKLRPDVQTFLERVAEMFDVMIFTASDKDYADKILNFLDPRSTLISRRAYLDSGRFLSDGYVKDLSVFGLDLAKVAIIDNCPHHFRLQKDNGIPIKSWFADSKDRELVSLIPFLEGLVAGNDVRPIIAERFGGYKRFGNRNVNAAQGFVKQTENIKCKGRAVRSMENKEHKKSTPEANLGRSNKKGPQIG